MPHIERGELELELGGELVQLEWECTNTEPENFDLVAGMSIERDDEFSRDELMILKYRYQDKLASLISEEMESRRKLGG